MPIAKNIVENQKTRVHDKFGSGQYGASRDAGTRTHNGIDIIASPNESIFCPIQGSIVRQAMPYKDDPSYEGVVIEGREEWSGYELKIFYMEGLFSGDANESQKIGFAQNLTKKYPNITNHIHLEVRYKGELIDPFELWQYSF